MQRCERHDLARGPDGLCVLCARDAAPRSDGRVAIVVALLVVAGVAVAGVLHVRKPSPIAAAPAPSPTIAAVPTETATTAMQAPTSLAPPPPENTPFAPVATAVAAATTVQQPSGPDPIALRVAARNVNIVMYTTTWCPQCRKAKAWLNENDVRFVEHDIEASDSDLAACKKLNPVCSIPTIDIDGEVIVGFGPAHMRAAIDNAARRRLSK